MSAIDQTPAGAKPWEIYTQKQRWMLLFILFLVSTSNYLDRNIIGVLIEPIKAEFKMSDTMVGLLTGFSFALCYATLGIPVARWADRGNRKVVVTSALVVWSLMTALCGMASNVWMLILARVGVGAGEAGAIPPAQSLLADYFPPEQRAKALGFFMMSATVGLVLGMILGGRIADNWGWRAAFLVVAIPGLLLAVVTWFGLKEPRLQPQFAVRADSHETLLETAKALLAKRSYVYLTIGMVLYFLMAYGALVFVTPFVIRVHHLTLTQAGDLMGSLGAVGALVGSFLGGWVSDKLAMRDISWLARLPGIVLIAVLPFYELMFIVPHIWQVATISFVAGLMLTGSIPAMFSALHVVCGSKRRAMAIAITFAFSNLLGLGCGPLIAGQLSDHFGAIYGVGDGLRYSLMIVMTVFIPCGVFLLLAARHLKADAEA
jgi:predicted MFS family arabinose efflux permease